MKYLINILLFVGLSFSVDILSVKLPVNAKSLSFAGYGINHNEWVNPACLNPSDQSHFEFSNNQWLFDVSGSYISYTNKKSKLSGYYWQVEDIELYDEEPSSSPLGTFGSKTFFIDYTQGFNLADHQFGFSAGYSYMKLLEYEDKGFTFDLGYKYNLNPSSSIAFLIRNLNTGFKDQIPEIIVLGTSQKINGIPIVLNLDFFHDDDNGTGSYQGLIFNSRYAAFKAGYRYYHESEELDIGLGVDLLWNNLEFSISTLIKENDALGTPVFYQISYYF